MSDGVVVAYMPARNEAENLPLVLASMRLQTKPFDLMIVIDDASTDCTAEIASEMGAELISLTRQHKRLTGLAEIATIYNRVFNWIEEHGIHYDYLMQHGADTVLPLNYNETMLKILDSKPRLVIASGQIYGEPTVLDHARGSGRYYKAWFWDRYIKRFPLVYLWESYPIYKALSLGYDVRSYPELLMITLRPTYYDKPQYGYAMKELGYLPYYALWCCIKTMLKEPRTGLNMLRTYLCNHYHCYDPEIKEWIRRIQVGDMKHWLRLNGFSR